MVEIKRKLPRFVSSAVERLVIWRDERQGKKLLRHLGKRMAKNGKRTMTFWAQYQDGWTAKYKIELLSMEPPEDR